MTTGERIKALRLQKNMSQEELGNKIGVKKAAINKYEMGVVVNLKRSTIANLAEALDCSPAYLMGWEDGALPSNVIYMPEPGKVPLVGRIACGTPILAEENIEEYVDLPKHIKADFALTCTGDSMIDLGIHEGAVVYIKEQKQVENGQIAAISVDGEEATLKRFYRNGETVMLVPANRKYEPKTFVGEEINRLNILGRAIAYTQAME